MIEVRGDLWETDAPNIAITTNGAVRRDGSGVMGAGVAAQARARCPGIERALGAHVSARGNVPGPLGSYQGKRLWSLPTKHVWSEASDPNLIGRSLEQLRALIPEPETLALPRPGCSNGRLEWTSVRPIVEKALPEPRFIVTDIATPFGPTRVVDLNHERFDVYIGRAGKGFDGYFGNPFPLESFAGDRATCLRAFEAHFFERLAQDPTYFARILSLRGKRLGCFCAPLPCHGHVIARFLDSLPSDPPPFRLAVVGSRSFPRLDQVRAYILALPPSTLVVSGGAPGVDALALSVAAEASLPFELLRAQWSAQGPTAGFSRNALLVARSHQVAAFLSRCESPRCASRSLHPTCPFGGWSHGTSHTIRLAQACSPSRLLGVCHAE